MKQKFAFGLLVMAVLGSNSFAADRAQPAGPCERAAAAAGRSFLERQIPETFDLMDIKSDGNKVEMTFENDEETDIVVAQVSPGRIPDTCRVISLKLANQELL